MDTVNVALADSDRENVTMRDRVAVNVAEAARDRYVCLIMETVNVADALIVLQYVGILDSAAVNVALTDNAR
jgi:hypothetical protein